MTAGNIGKIPVGEIVICLVRIAVGHPLRKVATIVDLLRNTGFAP